MTTYTTILFDLDGTLLDTNELILSSFLHACQTCLPDQKVTREELIPLMGRPLYDIMDHLAPDQVEELVAVYREHNLRTHDEMVTAFPYVLEVIKQLHDRHIQMGIVTTKMRGTAERGLKLFDLWRYMDSVITLDDVEHPKPHPEPVLKAMKELQAIPKSTLMVGDSSYDIESATNAGIDSAGVSWSLKGEEHLLSFSPTYMLQDLRDLLPISGVEQGGDQ